MRGAQLLKSQSVSNLMSGPLGILRTRGVDVAHHLGRELREPCLGRPRLDSTAASGRGFQDWNTGDISMNNWLVGILAFGRLAHTEA